MKHNLAQYRSTAATWSKKIQRYSIEKEGTAEDIANLPPPTVKNYNRKVNVSRKVKESTKKTKYKRPIQKKVIVSSDTSDDATDDSLSSESIESPQVPAILPIFS